MTGSNYSGSFKQAANNIRLTLAAQRALKTRVRLLRILASGRWNYTRDLFETWPLRSMGGAE